MLTETYDVSPGAGSFTLASGAFVVVPAAGWYLVTVSVHLQNTDDDNPQEIGCVLSLGGTVKASAYNTVVGGGIAFTSLTELVHITNTATQRINLSPASNTGLPGARYGLTGVAGALVVRRVVTDT